jgi:hypothetical protein
MAAVITLVGIGVFAAGIIAVASMSIRREDKTKTITVPRPHAAPARLPCAQAPRPPSRFQADLAGFTPDPGSAVPLDWRRQ